jgi:hypothetical protein
VRSRPQIVETWKSKVAKELQTIAERLSAIDRAHPVLDRQRVEDALAEHFRRLKLDPPQVRWAMDAVEAFLAGRGAQASCWVDLLHRAERGVADAVEWRNVVPCPSLFRAWATPENDAEQAARTAARAAIGDPTAHLWGERIALSAVYGLYWEPGRSWMFLPKLRCWLGFWLPLVDAAEAGLWLAFLMEREIIAVPRPALRIEEDRLHCEDGPAVSWPSSAEYFFWRGVQVPERVILAPDSLTAAEIAHEGNVEVRRVIIERFGAERYLSESGARKIHADDYGTLWRADLQDDEPLVVVEVLNSTPEPDGPFRDYFLRVPPGVRTAREAVAWTFGYDQPREYRPEVQT